MMSPDQDPERQRRRLSTPALAEATFAAVTRPSSTFGAAQRVRVDWRANADEVGPECRAERSQSRRRSPRLAGLLKRAGARSSGRPSLAWLGRCRSLAKDSRMPQPQGARLPPPRLHPPHAAKAMQSSMMFPDRTLSDRPRTERVTQQRCAASARPIPLPAP